MWDDLATGGSLRWNDPDQVRWVFLSRIRRSGAAPQAICPMMGTPPAMHKGLICPRRQSGSTAMGRTVWILLVAIGVAGQTDPARAQNYPSRALRIIVPFAAGGSVDLLARVIGNKVSEQ